MAVLQNFIRAFLLIVTSFFSSQYVQIELYDFPEPAPFIGTHVYNPYQEVGTDTVYRWYRANFHTHARAWQGITHGEQPGEEVLRAYQALNYDLPCISDYYSINGHQNQQSDQFMPVYEHGANVHKSHRLAIGSSSVDYYDVTLWQNQSIRQYLIERLNRRSSVVCIAHPSMVSGHPTTMLRYLSGYDCMEVLNSGRIDTPAWDTALSSGKPVWLLANDDCHNVRGNKLANSWTMLHAAGLRRDSVLLALRRGQTYGVHRRTERSYGELRSDDWQRKTQNVLTSLRMKQDTLSVRLRQPAERVRFIGQNGAVKKIVTQTSHAEYILTEEDTYVRVEADYPELAYYFNPVVRVSDEAVPQNTLQATLRIGPTVLVRLLVVGFNLALAFILYPALRKRLVQLFRRHHARTIWSERSAKA